MTASPDITKPPYKPPLLVVLGTLQQLTKGGTSGPADGNGGAGASGTLP